MRNEDKFFETNVEINKVAHKSNHQEDYVTYDITIRTESLADLPEELVYLAWQKLGEFFESKEKEIK